MSSTQAQLLDGRALARTLRDELKTEIENLQAAHHVTPTLSILRLGEDKAVAGYARSLRKNCERMGAAFQDHALPGDSEQQAVDAALQALNADPAVHGIMLLEPLPDHLDQDALVMRLDSAKDVDGVHPVNAGRLAAQRPPYFAPATPAGGIRLLEETGESFQGKRAVMVGRSDIVGKPMAMLLLHRHCTVTIAHSRTVDLPALCREADILCVAVGRPGMVSGAWVKPGATVVDFGTTYTADGVQGDCDQESVAEVAGKLTPVPGGTGPMTNIMLMRNLVDAAQRASAAQTGDAAGVR
jgi:methylenetetrahydrofolate dehydrogenase (NADP+)/methenyltetrahydrofolate cyclohydrolase